MANEPTMKEAEGQGAAVPGRPELPKAVLDALGPLCIDEPGGCYGAGLTGFYIRGPHVYAADGVLMGRVTMKHHLRRCGVYAPDLSGPLDTDYPDVDGVAQWPVERVGSVDARQLQRALTAIVAMASPDAPLVRVDLSWHAYEHVGGVLVIEPESTQLRSGAKSMRVVVAGIVTEEEAGEADERTAEEGG